jgi:hypothetical protein
MKNSILNLEGVQVLSRNEQKIIFAGKLGPDTCQATCTDGSKVYVSSCDSGQTSLACNSSGGASGCACGVKGPFDPPSITAEY